MPQTSSLGTGAPKHRTINVEVNLLSEWIQSRNRLREERLRWTGILATTALVALASLPFLSDTAAHHQSRRMRALRAVEAEQRTLSLLEQQQDAIQPQLDAETTLALCRERSRRFLSQALFALNAANSQTAIESMEANVIGGEISLRAKAQAENYKAAQDYVATAGQGLAVKSAILASARQNPTFGPEWITFEFAKKIEVSP